MYVNTRGLGKYRGMGLNCPGDPGCPGYVEPGSADYQTSLLQEILTNQQSGYPESIAPVNRGGSFSFTSWLNQNSGTALAIGGGVFALLLVAKAGR